MARRRRIRVRPITGLSLNRMIPNILTMLALCAGMTAIRLAIDAKFESAAIAVIVAGILDGMDGRIARLLKGTSPFGAQLASAWRRR
jgi:CDP-diacylglycerol--serine O-phosphatidyltransferase